jgi:hypothetical protein
VGKAKTASKTAEDQKSRSKPPGGKRRSAHLTELQNEIIRDEMLVGAVKREIHAALDKKGMTLPDRTLDFRMAKIREEWELEGQQEWPTRRARQLRRLYASIRYLLGKEKVKDVAPLERLVAQIEGNLAPIEITAVPKKGWDDLDADTLKQIKETGRLPAGITAEELDRALN